MGWPSPRAAACRRCKMARRPRLPRCSMRWSRTCPPGQTRRGRRPQRLCTGRCGATHGWRWRRQSSRWCSVPRRRTTGCFLACWAPAPAAGCCSPTTWVRGCAKWRHGYTSGDAVLFHCKCGEDLECKTYQVCQAINVSAIRQPSSSFTLCNWAGWRPHTAIPGVAGNLVPC